MNAAQLAKSMNVSESDVIGLAVSVAISMEKDKLSAEHAKDVEVVKAYIVHAAKKHEQFATIYHTNEEARELFAKRVLKDLMG